MNEDGCEDAATDPNLINLDLWHSITLDQHVARTGVCLIRSLFFLIYNAFQKYFKTFFTFYFNAPSNFLYFVWIIWKQSLIAKQKENDTQFKMFLLIQNLKSMVWICLQALLCRPILDAIPQKAASADKSDVDQVWTDILRSCHRLLKVFWFGFWLSMKTKQQHASILTILL